jgi:hypothetical protein
MSSTAAKRSLINVAIAALMVSAGAITESCQPLGSNLKAVIAQFSQHDLNKNFFF